MLSVIVYGRNDNHGYNMHKRIAISLNCIAETLTDPNDEILYVDYNTSNDLPSVIEAIQDTLTKKAKKLTRIFRVRSHIHDRFTSQTHAQVNEPLARNIALRRSNPKNRWILSTNTDMVFTPLHGKSLSEIAAEAKDGFYELARFEIPEPLWESLDRKDPKDIIQKAKEWGKSIHLNEVVYGNDTIIYDAPGDFQLALRDDMFKIGGFDERMIWGWHVDSNLCKRLKLLRGKVDILQDKIYGYHCNHTRMSGWMHMVKRKKENSILTFFEKVDSPYLESQKESWGLADEEVEEVRIGQDQTTNYISKLEKIITKPSEIEYTKSNYNKKGYGEIFYHTHHVFPFLAEQLTLIPKNSEIFYLGCNQKMLEMIQEFCKENDLKLSFYLPHSNEIKELICKENFTNGRISGIKNAVSKENCLAIFDFGIDKKIIQNNPILLQMAYKIFNIQEKIMFLFSLNKKEKEHKIVAIGIHNTQFFKTTKNSFRLIQNSYHSRVMTGRTNWHNQYRKELYYTNPIVDKVKNTLSYNNSLIGMLSIIYTATLPNLKFFLTYNAKKIGLNKKIRKQKRSLIKLLKLL